MKAADNLTDLRARAGESDGPETLQRLLSAKQLIVLGIGAIVGAGIFVATGTVAAHNAGPAIVLSFLIAAAGCLCAALCYAEFAAMVPVSGSAYSYVYAAFGQGAAWLIGWCLILEYLMAAANVAVGWSAYFIALLRSLGVAINPAMSSSPLAAASHGLIATGAVCNVPAILLLTAVTAVLAGGVRMSARANAVLVVAKLLVITLFVICGSFYVHPANWHPFVPENTGRLGEFGGSGVVRGAAAIFYAYLGFDTVSTAARETRDAQRSMPLGIIGSLLLCTMIYIAFSLVLTGLAPYRVLGVPNPASVALDYAGPGLYFVKVAVEIGAVLGLTSVALVLLYGQSRILFAMAQDGVVPAAFGHIRTRTRAPFIAIVACGVLAALTAGLLPTEVLGELISIGTLTAFVFVCGGVLYLRITCPEVHRPFRTPCAPVVCVAGMVICGYLIAMLPPATWWRFLAWIAVGAAIFLLYGRRRSMLVFAARHPLPQVRDHG